MMLLGTQKVNDKNHLEIGGCDVVDLAAEFGTPLYIMDEQLIREKCRAYRTAFEREYGNANVAYAGKAFMTTAMCALAAQEGMWLDVASGGELYTAVRANFPTDRIFLHGNFKTPDELDMAVQYGVKYVVLDSYNEINELAKRAEAAGRVQEVLIRCNPGVDPHTHRHISTGHEDSKFGFNIQDGSAMKAAKMVAATKGLKLKGLHCHVGSQLFDLAPYSDAAPVMIGFLKKVQEEIGNDVEVLDLGGGLAARYLEEQNPPSIEEFAKVVSESVIAAAAAENISKPTLFVEPGRSIVGESGTTVYTIGPIKEVSLPENSRKKVYLSVDGGLSDNPRPALYDALYSAIIANKAGEPPTKTYTVSGRHCETDLLIPSVLLPEANTGDLLAVQTTGAYNYAMASNYNKFCRPAVVFVINGKADLVVRRETIEDLVRCDLLPERLS